MENFEKKDYIVHHKDKNKENNSPENVLLFKHFKDHNMFHEGTCGELVQNEDGSVSCSVN